MIFFCDENVPPQLAKLLEVFDPKNEIRAHKDCFESGERDEVWIKELAGWDPKPTILGGDGRILMNPAELAVLQRAKLNVVLLKRGWTNLCWADSAWKIIKAWPRIVQNIERVREPTVFEVSVANLKVERVKALADYKARK